MDQKHSIIKKAVKSTVIVVVFLPGTEATKGV